MNRSTTLLGYALNGETDKVCQWLDEHPHDVHNADVFCQAVGWDQQSVVAAFLTRGADPNVIDKNGNRPLDMLCYGDVSVQMFELLIKAGATPSASEDLMRHAASGAAPEILRRLIHMGLDLNKKSRSGTPLECAARMGREDIVEILLGAGASAEDIDASKPIRPFKGAPTDKTLYERIRLRIEMAKRTEQSVGSAGEPAPQS